jgi:hypothetical protein
LRMIAVVSSGRRVDAIKAITRIRYIRRMIENFVFWGSSRIRISTVRVRVGVRFGQVMDNIVSWSKSGWRLRRESLFPFYMNVHQNRHASASPVVTFVNHEFISWSESVAPERRGRTCPYLVNVREDVLQNISLCLLIGTKEIVPVWDTRVRSITFVGKSYAHISANSRTTSTSSAAFSSPFDSLTAGDDSTIDSWSSGSPTY